MNIEQVIEDMLHVRFFGRIRKHVINAALPQVLGNQLLSCDVGIPFQFFFAGWLEAKNAIAHAVLFFDFFWASGALKRDNARDKVCVLSKSVLVLVHLLKHLFVQIEQAAIVKRVAHSL